LTPDVQSLRFSFFDGAGVAVSLQVRADTADPDVPGGVRTQRLTSTVPLRNFGS